MKTLLSNNKWMLGVMAAGILSLVIGTNSAMAQHRTYRGSYDSSPVRSYSHRGYNDRPIRYYPTYSRPVYIRYYDDEPYYVPYQTYSYVRPVYVRTYHRPALSFFFRF